MPTACVKIVHPLLETHTPEAFVEGHAHQTFIGLGSRNYGAIDQINSHHHHCQVEIVVGCCNQRWISK